MAKANGKRPANGKAARLSDFKPQRRNANKGNARGLTQLDKSLRRDGYSAPMVAAADGEIFAGSKRLERSADVFGMDIEPIIVHSDGTRPVIHVRDDILSAADPRAVRLGVADNAIAHLDYEPDGELLALLAAEDAAIAEMVKADELSMKAALEFTQGEIQDSEPQIDRAEELREKWQTERGQLWRIGEHRLLCGDSTKREDVERVMGGEKAEMVWTDPPYGVAVGDKNKYLNSIAPSNRVEKNLENDTLDELGLIAMLGTAFDNAIAFCTAGAAWYVAAPAGPLHLLFGAELKTRGIWRQTIQWVKNNSTFSPMGVCYHWQAEPIFFGWLPNGGHRYYGGRTQTTVWNIDRPTKSPEHPTMKPVELVARAVINSSLADEIVFDCFAGSGTTLVACQNLSRRGRGIEISPAYCAVILERMATAFPGIEIERL